MKDGICIKCKAENVRVTQANRTGLSVPFMSNWSQGALTNFYVCGKCGYLEIYVAEQNDLARINKDWPQATVKK